MTRIGYYRLPPARNLAPGGPQHLQLQAFGCAEIFHDNCYALGVTRPGLELAFARLEPSGVLVVPSFHALAGTMVDLLAVCSRLVQQGHQLVALKEQVDTRHDQGFFVSAQLLTTFNADRVMVRRVEAGIVDQAKSLGGRPALISDAAWIEVLPRLKDKGPDGMTIAQAAEQLDVSYDTVARKLRATKD